MPVVLLVCQLQFGRIVHSNQRVAANRESQVPVRCVGTTVAPIPGVEGLQKSIQSVALTHESCEMKDLFAHSSRTGFASLRDLFDHPVVNRLTDTLLVLSLRLVSRAVFWGFRSSDSFAGTASCGKHSSSPAREGTERRLTVWYVSCKPQRRSGQRMMVPETGGYKKRQVEVARSP